MLLNYYYSSIKDERNLQPIQPCDLENLNRILSNSKKKRCSQRKFGSVKLALDVYRGNMRSCLIIADNSIIHICNSIEYICCQSDYEYFVK